MSISNRHSILPFIAATSAPLHNQRLAKITFKGRNNKPAQFPSVCASLPIITNAEAIAALQQYPELLNATLSKVFEATQDEIIRSLYVSTKASLGSVSDEEISIAAINAFISASSASGRLTKALIESWFDTEALDIVAALLCNKLGIVIPESGVLGAKESEMIEPHLAGWKEVFSSLSGGATVLLPKQINNLKIVLSQCAEEDAIAGKLLERLNVMEKPKLEKVALLDLG